MSAWTCHPLMARPSQRSLHLVLGSHDGRALVPIPKRSASPRVTSTSELVDSLKALDPNRPIREADITELTLWGLIGGGVGRPCRLPDAGN
jgi:hypothetical protein